MGAHRFHKLKLEGQVSKRRKKALWYNILTLTILAKGTESLVPGMDLQSFPELRKYCQNFLFLGQLFTACELFCKEIRDSAL